MTLWRGEMKPSDPLARFVYDALNAGRSRQDISDVLDKAGWSEPEIRDALNAWATGEFTPPVPRPRPFVSAREAFLYGLMFIALGMVAWHLIALMFNLIDRWISDVTDTRNYYDRRSMRFSIASLIVFFPLFGWLNMQANRAIQANAGRRRSTVRKWFGYITLFLAAITLLGDLIWVIYALLNGDLTLRFFAKSAMVALVAGLVFAYFRADMTEDSNDD